MDKNENRIKYRPVCKVIVALILCLVFICAPACIGAPAPAQPAPAQPEPEPSSTPSPAAPEPSQGPSVQTTEWQADGIINDGEYADTQVFGNYELWWTSDDMHVFIGIRASTSGWVAMALGSGQAMKDADIILGFVQDGKVMVYDQYSTGMFGPHVPDDELGGSDDILDFGGKEEGGYTIIEFNRKLDTGDKYDRVFTRGKNSILWAYGADDQPDNKHMSRGHGEIDL